MQLCSTGDALQLLPSLALGGSMKRVRSLLFIAMVWVPAAASAQAGFTQRQIAALEDGWIQAVIKRDAVAFERLLAADFVYTEDGRVYNKKQLITEITTGSDTVTSGRNEDLAVHVH